MNTEFDSEPVYGDNDKYIKAKITSYGDKLIQFLNAKNTKTKCMGNGSFSLVMLDPVIRVNKGYYPEILLEE